MNTRLNTVNELMAKTLRLNTLGLTISELEQWLGVGKNTYARWEYGLRKFPDDKADMLESLVGTRDSWADDMVHTAMGGLPVQKVDGPLGRWSGDPVVPVRLPTYADDEAFWAACPQFQGIPAGVHRSAAALAWSRLRAAGVAAVIVDAMGGEMSKA